MSTEECYETHTSPPTLWKLATFGTKGRQGENSAKRTYKREEIVQITWRDRDGLNAWK